MTEGFSGKKYNIAIDGGAGTGKGTLAKPVAELLGYKVLDAGAMYRAATKFFHDRDIRPEIVSEHLNRIESLSFDGRLPSVNGKKLEDEIIRTQFISDLTPEYCESPEFKDMIIGYQKQMLRNKGWVGEGRNIAFSVMLGDCDFSFYLHASPHTRATWRREQRGWAAYKQEEVFNELISRDERDYNHSPPLMKPEVAKKRYDCYIDIDREEGSIAENFRMIVRHIAQNGIDINHKKLDEITKKLIETDPHLRK